MNSPHNYTILAATILYYAPFSDHRPVILTYDATSPLHVPTLRLPSTTSEIWRLELNTINNTDYLIELSLLIQQQLPAPTHPLSLRQWWDSLQSKITSHAKKFTKKLTSQYQNKVAGWTKQLMILEASPNINDPDYQLQLQHLQQSLRMSAIKYADKLRILVHLPQIDTSETMSRELHN